MEKNDGADGVDNNRSDGMEERERVVELMRVSRISFTMIYDSKMTSDDLLSILNMAVT